MPPGRGAGPRAGSCRRRRTGRGSAAGCPLSTRGSPREPRRAAARSRAFSQTTSRSMMPCSRSRSARCSVLGREAVGMRRGVVDELREQHRRAAASGRRAHHRCSVDGWPWRIDFSRADSRLIVSSGSATSISLRVREPRHRLFDRSSSAQNGSRPRAQVVSHLPRWPVASKSAGVEAGERILQVADLVVLGPARVDAHERQSVARRAVERREHLVVGDEVLRAGDAGLDLDPDRVVTVTAGRGRRSRGC